MSNQVTQMQVLLTLKDQMSSAMGNIQKSLAGLKNMALSVAGALTAAFGIKQLMHFGKEILEAAEHIKKLSTITGISTTAVQKFGAAAEATGANFDRLATGMKLLAEHAEKAAHGNKAMIEMFIKMGMTVTDANGNLKNGEQLMMEFADVLKNTHSQTERMAMAVELLGKSGEELLPVLQIGSEGLRAIGDAAEKVGFIMSKKTVNDLATFNRQWEQLKTGIMNAISNWLSSTEVTIPKIIEAMTPWAVKAVEIFGEIKKGFNAMMQWGEALARTLGIWFDVIKKELSFLFEAFDTYLFQPFISFVQGMASVFAPALAKSIGSLKTAIETLKAGALLLLDSDPVLKEAAIKTAAAWRVASEDIDKYNADTDASTKKTTENVAEYSKNLQNYLNMTAKVTQGQDQVTGSATKEADAFTKVTAGFKIAVAEFVAKGKQWKDAWLDMFSSIENGMTSALDKFILEGGKFKDLAKDIFMSVEKSFVHMLTTMATQAAMNGILGMFMPGGGKTGPSTVATVDNGMMSPHAMAMNLMGKTSEGSASANPGQNLAMTGGGGGGGIMSTSLGGDLTMGGALAGLGVGAMGFGMYKEATTGGRVNVTQSTMGGALTGMAAGAMIGSVIPGIGTVIGGLVGLVAGGVGGWLGGKSEKKKQQKAEEEAARAQREQEEAMRNQARQLIMASVRAKYGGGLADISVMPEIGEVLSHGITNETLDKIASASSDPNAKMAGEVSNITVGNPQITVNAQVAGSYDVQRLAEDLGIHLASSIRSAASGAGI